MNRGFNKNLHWYLLLAFLISFVILVFQSEGTEGGADDIEYYRYARYAFDHPEYFFDTKAKTVFTSIRAPVAQLGYDALRILNVLLGLATALLTFLTAKRLNYRHPVLALFLLIFAPAYAVMMLSGMNEVMFSFFLILGIFLFFRNEYIWSAVVISLLPFIRTEGFVIFPVFMLAFALQRQWKAIPFLLSGFLLVSLAGSFHHKDFFWVITRNPYSGDARDIYGSGPLLHYVNHFRPIFGLPFFVLIVGGLLYIPVHYFRERMERKVFINEVLIGFMPFLAYFVAHSYVYWKGMGNSVGLTRVIAAVIPSAALLGLFGWNGLMRMLRLPGILKNLLPAALAAYLVFVPFRVFGIPVGLGPPQKLMEESAAWLKDMGYNDRKIYFWDPFLWFFLDMDPTDGTKLHWGLYDRSNPGRNIFPGEIVLWDAHFGPNEGRTPLERLRDNPDFFEMKVFRPDPPFKVLGGYDYEIHIFERLKNPVEFDEQALLNEIRRKEDSVFQLRVLAYYDFEDLVGREDSSNYSGVLSRSGSYSYRLHQGRAFLPGLEAPLATIDPSAESRLIVRISHYFEGLGTEDPLYLVMSLENDREIIFYRTWEIKAEKLNAWEYTDFELPLPGERADDNILKIYLWNMGGHRVCLDDFIIAMKEPGDNIPIDNGNGR